jgi:hypothetical protein
MEKSIGVQISRNGSCIIPENLLYWSERCSQASVQSPPILATSHQGHQIAEARLHHFPTRSMTRRTALYQSSGGPDWHIKDNWMNGSNPCGSGTINTTWFGVECATFEAAPSNKSLHRM